GFERMGSIGPSPNDPPSMGSVCEYLRQRELCDARRADNGLPDYVYMPFCLGWGTALRRSGPYAGFLGSRFDPLFTECVPFGDGRKKARSGYQPVKVRGRPALVHSELAPGVTVDRLDGRRGLLRQLDDQFHQ